MIFTAYPRTRRDVQPYRDGGHVSHPTETELSVDVIVVGGGMSGASVAYEIAEHRTVALLERESTLAFHTTGRSAATFIENYGNSVIRMLTAGSRDFIHRPSGRLRPSPGHLPAAADHRRLRAHGCTAGIAPPGCSARVQHRAGRRRGGRGDQPLPTTRIHPAGDGRFDADGARCSWPAPGICAWPASAWGNHCEVGRNRERGPPTWALGPAGLLGAGLRGSDRHQCRGGVVR
ncbi:inorganic polyphosphate/ATP-NAD kinase [Mycobacteroides abscessus subsp. abscessus]|nr:inorganic polyphosphate/ATP-NAD kinase [Mycobacteroides abscessus subsp. abscessus]